jgi:hypothetical protein
VSINKDTADQFFQTFTPLIFNPSQIQASMNYTTQGLSDKGLKIGLAERKIF